jgi:hypothetical protein
MFIGYQTLIKMMNPQLSYHPLWSTTTHMIIYIYIYNTTCFHMADVFGLLDHEDESTVMLQNVGIFLPSYLSLPSKRPKPNK